MSWHLDELHLFDLALDALDAAARARAEAHLAGCPACASELRLVRELVTGAVPAAPPPPALRGRVLASAARPGSWGRYRRELGQLLDLPEEDVDRLLREAADPTRWAPGAPPQPGVELFPLKAGPRWAGAEAGLVRLAPGTVLRHRHHGDEHCLYLEGGIEDSDGRVSRPGDLLVLPGGSLHDFRALPGGAVLAVVSHGFSAEA